MRIGEKEGTEDRWAVEYMRSQELFERRKDNVRWVVAAVRQQVYSKRRRIGGFRTFIPKPGLGRITFIIACINGTRLVVICIELF